MLSACGEVDLAGGADYTIFLINRQQAPHPLLLQWCEGENPFAQESATKQLFFVERAESVSRTLTCNLCAHWKLTEEDRDRLTHNSMLE